MTESELRSLFPHTRETVYLNHAATGPISRPVLEAIDSHLKERQRTNIENYEAFAAVTDEALERVAQLLGTRAERVEFAQNTSYGLDVVARGLDWQEGDRLAVPACEFPANVYPFLNLRDRGVEVDFIPHQEATFSLDAIDATLTPRTRLLSLSWVQFLSGFRTDLSAVGRLCRERDVLLCVDAIQGLGALRLDVEAAGIDFLACGGQKWLMATQGIGFLYVAPRLQRRLIGPAGWLHGPVDWDDFFEYDLRFHDSARRFRLGTLNSIGIAGLHATLGLYDTVGPDRVEVRVLNNARRLADGLEELGFQRYGTSDPARASGIVTVRCDRPEVVCEHLSEAGIEVAVRSGLLRFAPHYYNTADEIDHVLGVLATRSDG